MTSSDLPDLSKLATTDVTFEEWLEEYKRRTPWSYPSTKPLPEAPTDEGTGRYFYLWHRPADSPSPYPEGVRKIIESGGLVPGTDQYRRPYPDDPRGRAGEMRPDDWSGFSERIESFLDKNMNSKRRLTIESGSFKGMVVWCYLDEKALQFANEDELVYRIPGEWLEYNALFCSEQPPRSNKTHPDYAPPRMVLDMKIPTAYRITSNKELRNEKNRLMSRHEVGAFLYYRHRKANPTSRDEYMP